MTKKEHTTEEMKQMRREWEMKHRYVSRRVKSFIEEEEIEMYKIWQAAMWSMIKNLALFVISCVATYYILVKFFSPHT